MAASMPEQTSDDAEELRYLLEEFRLASRRLYFLDLELDEWKNPFLKKMTDRWERHQDQGRALDEIRRWLEARGGSYRLDGAFYQVVDGDVRVMVLVVEE